MFFCLLFELWCCFGMFCFLSNPDECFRMWSFAMLIQMDNEIAWNFPRRVSQDLTVFFQDKLIERKRRPMQNVTWFGGSFLWGINGHQWACESFMWPNLMRHVLTLPETNLKRWCTIDHYTKLWLFCEYRKCVYISWCPTSCSPLWFNMI